MIKILPKKNITVILYHKYICKILMKEQTKSGNAVLLIVQTNGLHYNFSIHTYIVPSSFVPSLPPSLTLCLPSPTPAFLSLPHLHLGGGGIGV
jgi:hypothetical protein